MKAQLFCILFLSSIFGVCAGTLEVWRAKELDIPISSEALVGNVSVDGQAGLIYYKKDEKIGSLKIQGNLEEILSRDGPSEGLFFDKGDIFLAKDLSYNQTFYFLLEKNGKLLVVGRVNQLGEGSYVLSSDRIGYTGGFSTSFRQFIETINR